jgi:heme A synthase
MRQRLLNIGILLSFLVCYLEWGGGHSAFVAQVHYQVLVGKPEAQNFVHPMIALPFLGELLLLFTLFQQRPSRRLTTIGIVLMSVFVLLLALIGVLSKNVKIGLSTLPFLTLAVLHFVSAKRSA